MRSKRNSQMLGLVHISELGRVLGFQQTFGRISNGYIVMSQGTPTSSEVTKAKRNQILREVAEAIPQPVLHNANE